MENNGIKCDVCECVHNTTSCKCDLCTVEITHMKTSAEGVAIPHFCKSYQQK